MIERQRRVLTAATTAAAISLVYVPYRLLGRAVGYSLLGDPPHEMATIDMAQMVITWALIALASAVAWATYGNSGPKPSK
jgi:hypothetical protein